MSPAQCVLPGIALMLIGSAAIAGSELEAWTTTKAADSCAAWQGFIDAYPDGKLAGIARTRLDDCAAANEPSSAAQSTPATAPTETASPTMSTAPERQVAEPPISLATGSTDTPPVVQPPPGPTRGTPAAESFIVLPASDGFVAVRRDPSTRSKEVGRLYADQRIACAAIVRGQRLRYGDRWVHCPLAGGYIYATLLTPELTGAAARRFVVRPTSDGFAAVRSAATTSRGHRVAKLTAGQVIYCDRLVRGKRLSEGPYWLHCPDAGGYIHAPLLIPD